MRRLSISILGIFLFYSAFSQKRESAIWKYGWRVTFDFNNSPTRIFNSEKIYSNGVAAICDSNGTLQFSSNGFFLYNRNEFIQTKLDTIYSLNNPPSGFESSLGYSGANLIIPYSKSSLYHYFNIRLGSPEGKGVLVEYKIDMKMSNGLGGVDTFKTRIFAPEWGYQLAAMFHANGKDSWLIGVNIQNAPSQTIQFGSITTSFPGFNFDDFYNTWTNEQRRFWKRWDPDGTGVTYSLNASEKITGISFCGSDVADERFVVFTQVTSPEMFNNKKVNIVLLRKSENSNAFSNAVEITGFANYMDNSTAPEYPGLPDGVLKASPNRRFLVMTNTIFNNRTGQARADDGALENAQLYSYNAANNTITRVCQLGIYGIDKISSYGASFSPNSKRLYINVNMNDINGSQVAGIYQFDLESIYSSPPTNPDFILNGTKIASIPIGIAYSFGMQLGPDNKIYCAKPIPDHISVPSPGEIKKHQQLGVINFPDLVAGIGSAPNCGFSWEGMTLPNDTRYCTYGLPNFVDAIDQGPYIYPPDNIPTQIASGQTVSFDYNCSMPGSLITYTVVLPPGVTGAPSCTTGCNNTTFTTTLTNTNYCPVDVIYTFTARGDCQGPPTEVKITVLPNPPVLTVNGPSSICSGIAVNLITSPPQTGAQILYWVDQLSELSGLPACSTQATACTLTTASLSFIPVLTGTVSKTVIVHFVTVLNGCTSPETSYSLIVNPPCAPPNLIGIISTCDPTNSNFIVLSPIEPYDGNLTYSWQKKNGSTWANPITVFESYSFVLDNSNSAVTDGIYRLYVTTSGSDDAQSAPFHLLGQGSPYTSDQLFETGETVYITNTISLSGKLSLNSASAFVRGMATYNANTVGGEVQGAYIYLLEGGKIILNNNSYLGSACQNMWGGIRLNSQEGSLNSSGKIELHNSVLEGAYSGISSVSEGFKVGTFVLETSQIRNCFIGVKLNFGFDSLISSLTGTTFSSRYNRMLAPFDYDHNGSSSLYRPTHNGSHGDG